MKVKEKKIERTKVDLISYFINITKTLNINSDYIGIARIIITSSYTL